MSKRTAFLSLALSLLVGSLLLLPRDVSTRSTGAPSAYSSSPIDARTCATPGCHISMPVNRPGMIASDVPPEGYLPGQTYELTFTVTRPGVSKYGFQASPVDSFNQFGGTFAISDPGNTQLGAGFHYVTHTAAGNGGNGGRSWTASWTAPSTYPLWPVTIYAAFIAGDSLDNDSLYHSRLRLLPRNMGWPDADDEREVWVTGNGMARSLSFGFPEDAAVEAYDLGGRLLWIIRKSEGEQALLLPSLPYGIALIRVSWNGGDTVIKVGG